MSDTIIVFAFTLAVMLGILLLAFLGHFSAVLLENLTRKSTKAPVNVDEGKNDTDNARKKAVPSNNHK